MFFIVNAAAEGGYSAKDFIFCHITTKNMNIFYCNLMWKTKFSHVYNETQIVTCSQRPVGLSLSQLNRVTVVSLGMHDIIGLVLADDSCKI